MIFNNPNGSIHIPDGANEEMATSRTTYLGVGAHQDDLEIMASHGIVSCYQNDEEWFTGIICTSGSGSLRDGKYSSCSDGDMSAIRIKEQIKAADIGKYSAVIQLGYKSQIIKSPSDNSLKKELVELLSILKPKVVYTHNPADKHDTHVAVLVSLLNAIRELKVEDRPLKVYGCEVWRDLDWMDSNDRVAFDLSGHQDLITSLLGAYQSQISGGKRYDLATVGRMHSNATYSESHSIDDSTHLWYAMDLTALVEDNRVDLIDFVKNGLDRFSDDVIGRLKRLQRRGR